MILAKPFGKIPVMIFDGIEIDRNLLGFSRFRSRAGILDHRSRNFQVEMRNIRNIGSGFSVDGSMCFLFEVFSSPVKNGLTPTRLNLWEWLSGGNSDFSNS